MSALHHLADLTDEIGQLASALKVHESENLNELAEVFVQWSERLNHILDDLNRPHQHTVH